MRNQRSRTGAWKTFGLVLAVGLAVGVLPASAGAGANPAPKAGHGALSAPRTRELLAGLPIRTVGATRADGVSATAVSLSEPDPAGDATAKADITKVGARLTTASLRMSVTVPGATNPVTDPLWRNPLKSTVAWGIDTGTDGNADRTILLIAIDGGLDAWVVASNVANPVPLCSANATYETGGIFAVQFPAACAGSPAQITFGALVRYDYTSSTPNRLDLAPDGDEVAGPITAATTRPSIAGAVLVDQVGELHRLNVGGLPPIGMWSEYATLGTPRGLALTPDGGHGYVLSGSGRLFGISFARNNLPPRVYGAKSWPSQNVARGVAIRPNGGAGLVVDRFGNLYPFGIGAKKAAPTLLGVPKWPGVDMARGLAVMPDGKGGFTLDAFGGLHWFSIGTTSAAPAIIGGPHFAGDDARGVTILPDGTGGFVVDKGGALHFFSIGTARTPPSQNGSISFPGDAVRGVGVLTRLITRP